MKLILGALLTIAIVVPTSYAGTFGLGTRFVYVEPSAGIDSRLSNGGNKVDGDAKPELVLEYFPGSSKMLSMEYGLLYSQHSFIYGIPPAETGSTDLITQNFTIKLHPFANSNVNPYFGGGLNLAIPSSSHSTLSYFTIDNHVGWVVQAGIDFHISNVAWLNLDYRYLDMDTNARVNGAAYRFDISPHLFAFGVKYRR